MQEIDVQQEERDNRAASTPVDRLVLVCHGIGQAMTASNIAKDAACFRGVLQQMSQVRRLSKPGGLDVCCPAGSLSAPHHLCRTSLGTSTKCSCIRVSCCCLQPVNGQTEVLALTSLVQEVLEEDQQSKGRVEVLPVQWRKHLTLDVSGCLT